MATPVTLPALGESVTEGTVTRWLKQVGDTVAVDEPLLEGSTDKVDTEIPSPVAGTLLEIKANEDDTVEVGGVLGVIGEEGESAGDASESAEPEAQPKDAMDGWWHFFGLLRGEAELIEDRAEAQKLLVETNDPAAQQRLIRLSEALAVLRGGETDTMTEDGALRGATPASLGPSGAPRADTIG